MWKAYYHQRKSIEKQQLSSEQYTTHNALKSEKSAI